MYRLASLFLVLVCSPALLGQSTTSVNGTVIDPSGAVIPGAEIILENIDNNQRRAATSGSDGEYSFNLVAPGNYRITGKKSGFADAVINGVRLLVNTPATVNVTFEKVGAVAGHCGDRRSHSNQYHGRFSGQFIQHETNSAASV